MGNQGGWKRLRQHAVSALQTAVESVAQVVQPWLYFNIILRNSQIFLPVLDKVLGVQLEGQEGSSHCAPTLACALAMVHNGSDADCTFRLPGTPQPSNLQYCNSICM